MLKRLAAEWLVPYKEQQGWQACIPQGMTGKKVVGVARAFPPPCARATGGMTAQTGGSVSFTIIPAVVACCFDDVAPLPLSGAMFHYDCILSVSRVLWCVGSRARSSPRLGSNRRTNQQLGQTQPPPAPPAGRDGSMGRHRQRRR